MTATDPTAADRIRQSVAEYAAARRRRLEAAVDGAVALWLADPCRNHRALSKAVLDAVEVA